MALTEPIDIINAVRRVTGDLNADSYNVTTRDMWYYLKDAVDEIQTEVDFGYDLTITSTAATWNKTLYSTPFVLFKMKALILVLESSMHDNLWSSGNVQVGDIKIDVTQILKIRMENLKLLRADLQVLIKNIKMNLGGGGQIVDTYVRGFINNSSMGDFFTTQEPFL